MPRVTHRGGGYCVVVFLPLGVLSVVSRSCSALEVLEIAAWLKEEGTRLFKAGDFQGAAER